MTYMGEITNVKACLTISPAPLYGRNGPAGPQFYNARLDDIKRTKKRWHHI